jgi:GTP-binding protein Era
VSFRSGFAAVVGRPNVGKSTLVNSLVGGKVSITSAVAQTTRTAIRGVLDLQEAQVVFVDTPGYHRPRTLLGERLNEVVREAWSDVDVALFVVDAVAGVGRGDERIARELEGISAPVISVVNKIDAARPERVLSALQSVSRLGDWREHVPVSARTGRGTELLLQLTAECLPEGPQYYPPGTRTDQPPPRFVAELVREKLLSKTREELPHSIAVVTDDFEERGDGVLEIRARVVVERESQKGIVIGKEGSLLKAVGTEARREIEALFGTHVFLDLRVKVEKNWQRRPHSLDRLGFGRD